eukprot:UN21193
MVKYNLIFHRSQQVLRLSWNRYDCSHLTRETISSNGMLCIFINSCLIRFLAVPYYLHH